MTVLLLLLAALPLTVLVFVGGRRLRDPEFHREAQYAGPLPRTALIVPVKGAPQGMAQCLQALLAQDYPDYEVVFAVEDAADPALGVITPLLAVSEAQAPGRGRVVVAGVAEQCGQKNWNQLAALATVGADARILAFCDSTHCPQPDWLRRLVTPLVLGQAEATTAYHHVHPAQWSLAATGRCITVLALYLLQELPAVSQPWGGSMAVTRKTFEALGVAGIWARSVVDDVTLAKALEGRGLRAAPVVGASLRTDLGPETVAGWRTWLERQWLYLRYIYPGSWVGVGLLLYLVAGTLLWALGACLLGLVGAVLGSTWLLATGYLGYLAFLGLVVGQCHPEPGPKGKWLLGFGATLLMAAWSHVRTWFADGIRWGGIVYQVGRGGEVLAVRRP